jgi:hypothetical protein
VSALTLSKVLLTLRTLTDGVLARARFHRSSATAGWSAIRAKASADESRR